MNDQTAPAAACDVCVDAAPLFAGGERWTVTGPLTVDSASQVLGASQDVPLPGTGVVALGSVQAVDSAAVAVLLSWQRRAGVEGRKLAFADVPASLVALAELYGVEDLLQAGP
jgi:phospholipid transport system transporter-binding protein